MSFTDRIAVEDYTAVIYLEEKPGDAPGHEVLELMVVDTGDNAVSVKLEPNQVHKLRLALQRWERQQQ